ncbi:MAG: glycine zipper family protein [Deltaproteobacteria bacterium]|nr:glycine zipper family protein [Deltaproteobacteria bacterium]
MRKIIFAFSVVSILASCATYSPVVDPQSVRNDDKYYQDRAECRALAQANTSTTKSVAKDALIGGAVGAGTGSLIGVIAGDTVKGLALGSVIGGVAGGAKGVYEGNKDFEQIYRNCMIGRGYSVLN